MKSKWEYKCWGKVCHIFASNVAAVSYLKVNAGFQCSKHRHKSRANQFTVINGSIKVDTWGTGLNGKILSIPIVKFLMPGDTFTVQSGVWHRFRVIHSGEVVEVYWSDVPDGKVSIDDIERLDMGGLIDG